MYAFTWKTWRCIPTRRQDMTVGEVAYYASRCFPRYLFWILEIFCSLLCGKLLIFFFTSSFMRECSRFIITALNSEQLKSVYQRASTNLFLEAEVARALFFTHWISSIFALPVRGLKMATNPFPVMWNELRLNSVDRWTVEKNFELLGLSLEALKFRDDSNECPHM